MVEPVAQANHLQRILCAREPLFFRQLGIERWQLHVLQCRGAREQIEALKHKPELAIANRSECLFVESCYVHAIKEVIASGRLIEAAQQVHER